MPWISEVNSFRSPDARPHPRPEKGRRWRSHAAWPLAGVAMFLSSGCQLIVNPFADELAGEQRVTTASVDGALAATTTPRVATPRHPGAVTPTEVRPQEGTVTHGPLYFEDSFEDEGSDNNRFAWTAEDYSHTFYWRSRFLLNIVLFPISAVVTPPWAVMESDGYPSRRTLGRDHDAQRQHAESGPVGSSQEPESPPSPESRTGT